MSLVRTIARATKSALPMPARRILNRWFEQAVWLLPDRLALSIFYFRSHHRWPDLDDPKAMSEKVIAMRLADPPLERFGDKLRVKDWVASKIGREHVIPTLFAGKELPPRAERNWPPPFIIKTNNGSGGHIIVRDKPDWDEIEPKVRHMMAFDYGKESREYYYSRIDPMILVEPLIAGNDLPLEYKFFMFDGEVGMILVISDRQDDGEHRETYFRSNFTWWQRALERGHDPSVFERPPYLDELIALARTLSQGFAFVRVDLYHVDGQAYFAELTFYSAKGLLRIEPFADDIELGAMWDWSKPFVPGEVA